MIKYYREIVNEYMDIQDRETRKILLAIDEEDQSQVLTSLAHKLYDNVVKQVDKINFGSIPNTKGDITKLENYTQLVECVDIMEKMLVEYKQSIEPTNIIKTAIENIKSRTEKWEKAFTYNLEFPIVMYNTIVLSIVSSVSFLISATIDYVKSPGDAEYQLSINAMAASKTKDNLLFENLDKWNKACLKGDVDKCLDLVLDNGKKNLMGSAGVAGTVMVTVAITGIILNILPILRELIFFFYHSKQSLSDYFAIQADLLQMNAENVKYNTEKSAKEKEKIRKKQLTIANKFRKISDALAIKCKKAQLSAEKDSAKVEKKYKTTDIMDTMPDSAAASSIF